MVDKEKMIRKLVSMQLIDSKFPVTFRPMTGGVSSDIWLIDNFVRRYVLKEARSRLKVADYWEADLSRNYAEQQFIHFVRQFVPEAVPDILFSDPELPFFIMEYLGPPLENWKQKLLEGRFETKDAVRAARLLANIHNQGRNDPEVKDLFDYSGNFHALRIEPYLITTGQRNPALQPLFEAEAQRLNHCRETLVHGDFSPKNILVSDERMVLLDHEVANYGDPAFDLAFLLNHLLLKMFYLGETAMELPDLATTAWNTYFDQIEEPFLTTLKRRTPHLLLMLMLARVDGKSPVEYLDRQQQDFIRSFVHLYLPSKTGYDFHKITHLLQNVSKKR